MKFLSLFLFLAAIGSALGQGDVNNSDFLSNTQTKIRAGTPAKNQSYLDSAPGRYSTISSALMDGYGNIMLNSWGGITGGWSATNLTLVTPILSGSVTGTYTLAGTGTFTGGTFNSPTINTPKIVVNSLNNHLYNNFATAGQTPAATTRTYITGSGLTIAAGQIQVGTHVHWRFDLTKTAAGTAASTFDIAFGTAGTTSDTAQVSFTKPAGTAAGDEGWIDIDCVVKTNSSTGVVIGEFTMIHNLASTGHMTIPAACVTTTSSTFNTTTATNIGICITTGASDAVTINQVFTSADNL